MDKQTLLRQEYRSRINRVIDYIEDHLDKDLTLEELARVAQFSAFHFHKIFSAMIGETLNQFIQRVRIERAANLLVNNPKKSITEIAFDCGFSGSAPFARAFRKQFNMSASDWRSGGFREHDKIRQVKHKTGQPVDKSGKAFVVFSSYISGVTTHQTWRITMKEQPFLKADVEVKELPQQTVAYIRHIGPYQGDGALFESLYKKLFTWAQARDLLRFPETRALNVYHDDPEITDDDKLRLSVCITVPKDTKVDGEIGKMTLPGGKYAIGHFELDTDEFSAAWNTMFGGWMPESGYQPADGPCFEVCKNDCNEHPQGKHIIDICVPVVAL